MHRGIAKMLAVLAAATCVGCPEGDGGADYARRQAELADKDMLGKAVKVETTLPSGVQVACTELFDSQKLTSLLKEKEPIGVADLSAKSPDTTATCSLRRGGKAPDEKTQDKMFEETARLGVVGGDEICNVAVYCSIPADLEGLKARCQTEGMHGNDTIGAYACVKVTQKGADEGYSYRFIEPDSKCTVRVLGGPSVTDEAMVRSCAKATMELFTAQSFKAAAAQPE